MTVNPRLVDRLAHVLSKFHPTAITESQDLADHRYHHTLGTRFEHPIDLASQDRVVNGTAIGQRRVKNRKDSVQRLTRRSPQGIVRH